MGGGGGPRSHVSIRGTMSGGGGATRGEEELVRGGGLAGSKEIVNLLCKNKNEKG